MSYKLNFSLVGTLVNDTVCHSKSFRVESSRAFRLIRRIVGAPLLARALRKRRALPTVPDYTYLRSAAAKAYATGSA